MGHPAEQYFRVGGWCPKPGSSLEAFVIDGKQHSRGDEWECQNCHVKFLWGDNETGQRGSRVAEKIEKHVQLYKAHGKCVPLDKKGLKKKVAKQVKTVKYQLGISSDESE
jgi:hypothetical protein